MRAITITFILYVIAMPLRAEEWMEICEKYGSLATSIMNNRQVGVSMSKMMEAVDGDKLLQNLIIEAYDSPRFSTDKMQKKATERFRDDTYLACVKSMRPKN
ncbi:hypothetical protein [Vibrio sp. JZG120]